MSKHIKRPTKNKTGTADNEASKSNVVSLTKIRAAKAEKERRESERFFLNEMTQIYCLINGTSPAPVNLLELSETGCSFRVPTRLLESVKTDDTEICLEFQFTRSTRIRLGFAVRSKISQIDDQISYVRFGCEANKNFSSYRTYVKFVKFVQAIADYESGAVTDHRNSVG